MTTYLNVQQSQCVIFNSDSDDHVELSDVAVRWKVRCSGSHTIGWKSEAGKGSLLRRANGNVFAVRLILLLWFVIMTLVNSTNYFKAMTTVLYQSSLNWVLMWPTRKGSGSTKRIWFQCVRNQSGFMVLLSFLSWKMFHPVVLGIGSPDQQMFLRYLQ